MATNWIRGRSERPAKRRIVLIYETGDAKNNALEQLLDQIPYGHGNKTLLECLRLGAHSMLGQIADGSSSHATTPVASQPSAAPTSHGSGKNFSKSATRMFDRDTGLS
jgi:hypothetical protein